VTEHARFGRWGVGTGVLYFATGQLFYLLLPLHGGLDETGALRALVTLTTPMALVSSACAAVLGPALVRARGTPQFARRLRVALVGVLAVAVAYGLFIGLLHNWLLDVAYGGRYTAYGRWLWLLGLAIPAGAAAELLQAALRAVERPQRVFRAYAVSAAVAVVIGGGLILALGLPGAAVAVALSALTAAGVLWWGYAKSDGPASEGA
jgi:O-antigen/teichoic acid export membrane protein